MTGIETCKYQNHVSLDNHMVGLVKIIDQEALEGAGAVKFDSVHMCVHMAEHFTKIPTTSFYPSAKITL